MSNLKLKSTSFENLQKLLAKKDTATIGHNTIAHRTYGSTTDQFTIRYHGNAIAYIDGSGITFTNAGWGSPTTRNRLSIIADDNNVPVNFGQKNFKQTLIARKRMWNQPKEVHTFMSSPVWDMVTDEFSSVVWDKPTDTLLHNGKQIYSF